MKWNKPFDSDTVDRNRFCIENMMPPRSEIPEEFSFSGNINKGDNANIWSKWQNKWFFHGLDDSEIPEVKDGLDKVEVITHLSMIQRSYSPKHEHKCEAVAYLASLWFKEEPVLKK